MSNKDKRFDKIIASMKKKLQQQKYYEGQQMLKTLYSRLINQNKYDQASKLLTEGALTLMGHKKIKESVEIVNDLITTWKCSKNPSLNEERSQLLHELFCMIPQNDKQCINDFMKYVIEWEQLQKQQIIENEKSKMNKSLQQKQINTIDANMMALYKSYGIVLWNTKEYYKSSAALVRTTAIEPMVQMFAEWSQRSSSKERPYYIVRIVLQYLCMGNIKGARLFIQSACPRDDLRGPSLREPLENYSDLLVESIERKSVVLYNVVSKSYEPLLKFDGRLLNLQYRVAHVCLGIPMPRNKGGLMGNLLSLLS